MYSLCHSGTALLACALSCLGAPRTLRVCADPNNLPFSNQREEGFENRLAELVARDLGAKLEYTWWAERKSFLKNSLDAGLCDVVMGVPAALGSVAVTRPYYRSTYVFVSRPPAIASLDDPRLEKLRIGIHIVGDDYAPPANALTRRGLAANLVGYSLFGENGVENPPARLIDAVARGDVDVAIVWGPFAGYFAKQQKTPLEIRPVTPAMYLAVPFTYDIAIGVRKGETALRAELDRVLIRECRAIKSLLRLYEVPLVEPAEGRDTCESQPGSSSVGLH
jgi:mxaJ protein